MLPQPLIFLDLETTGMTATHERITEIGLLDVANGEVVGSWSQLVNPEKSIPPFIQSLTGITNDMVADAPTFEQLAPGLFERLAGKLLVAHNARFDYGFLKNEFGRLGLSYRSRVLCTAKLSRKLFPEHRRHNLDSLIERYGLSCSARHRALGDAEVLWQFLQKICAGVDAALIDAAVQAQMDAPSLPAGLSAEIMEAIPEAPGVYLFYDDKGAPVYVGKSVDLHARVRSHFAGDQRLAKDMRITQQVTRVEWIETAGELGALLAELRLIKELLPVHNRRKRRSASFYSWEWDGSIENKPPLRLVTAGDTEALRLENLFGTFRAKHAALAALSGIAEEHGLCPVLLGLEPGRTAGAACFSHQLQRCRGACCGKESVAAHNLRLMQALQTLRLAQWPYKGAIGLRESSGEKTEVHLFERWCFLGTARSEAEIYDKLEVRARPVFDLDIYKILKRELGKRSRGVDLIEFGPMSSLWYRGAEAPVPG
ncbi:MAG: exonuclease domain-containing protein [Burkholderiales bacterium]